MSRSYVMLCHMARGPSGRIVIELDPEEKEQIYAALKREGLTLKEWFSKASSQFLRRPQSPVFSDSAVVAETKSKYGGKNQPKKGKGK